MVIAHCGGSYYCGTRLCCSNYSDGEKKMLIKPPILMLLVISRLLHKIYLRIIGWFKKIITRFICTYVWLKEIISEKIGIVNCNVNYERSDSKKMWWTRTQITLILSRLKNLYQLGSETIKIDNNIPTFFNIVYLFKEKVYTRINFQDKKCIVDRVIYDKS